MDLTKILTNLHKLDKIKKLISSLESRFAERKENLEKIQLLARTLDRALIAVVFDLDSKLNGNTKKDDSNKITINQITYWLSDSLKILTEIIFGDTLQNKQSLKDQLYNIEEFFSQEYKNFSETTCLFKNPDEEKILRERLLLIMDEKFGHRQDEKIHQPDFKPLNV